MNTNKLSRAEFVRMLAENTENLIWFLDTEVEKIKDESVVIDQSMEKTYYHHVLAEGQKSMLQIIKNYFIYEQYKTKKQGEEFYKEFK